MDVQAYKAFCARQLADVTGSHADEVAACRLENQLLDALVAGAGLNNTRLPVPVPATQVGRPKYQAWVESLSDRF
jgi:hypothetical protein